MTKVSCWETKTVRAICADGHAEGSGQVCAGVSAIMYALAGWVENFGLYKREIRMEAGFSIVSAKKCPEVDAVFDMAMIGLQQIEKKHPEHIRVNEL